MTVMNYLEEYYNKMIFRKAGNSDEKAITALYKSVIGTRFCTWDESYPGEEEVREDLLAGSLYVLVQDEELIGAISVVPENELDALDCWQVRENACEFARVVIKPEYQHKGLSGRLVEGIILEIQKRQADAIHIAVAKGNIPAQKLYAQKGFSICGEADLYGHSFYLCERLL